MPLRGGRSTPPCSTATGIAALGALFEHQVTRVVTRWLAAVPGGSEHAQQVAHALSSAAARTLLMRAPATARSLLDHLAHSAYTTALNHVFAA